MKRSTALLKMVGYGVSVVLISVLLIYWIVGTFANSALWGLVVLLLVVLMIGIGLRSAKSRKNGKQ